MKNKWTLIHKGVASTPDIEVREGDTFKEAVGGRLICTMPETTTKTVEQVIRDSKLIVAAPELLDALEAMLREAESVNQQTISRHHIRALYINMAKEAIAKAKSDQP